MRPSVPLLAVALVLCGAAPGFAEGLMGRTVVFHVETWDNPAEWLNPTSSTRTIVGDGPEFGIEPLVANGLVLAPVTIDIGATRLDITFENVPQSTFMTAKFNGYVLSFDAECVLFTGASIDKAATTLPLEPDDVTVTPTSVRINVAGYDHGPEDRIGVVFAATECLMG